MSFLTTLAYFDKTAQQPAQNAGLDAKNKNTVRQYGKLIEQLTTGNKFAVGQCKEILARQGTTPEQAQSDSQYLASVIAVVEDFVVKMKAGAPV